ncbi:MAG: cyclic nucleotide-binding domain-containing protein, partial [Peptococcaceae bacterium]|nr:cyclic nucleotide-binding domain-containing protein [Peptococcaceae bacterium]
MDYDKLYFLAKVELLADLTTPELTELAQDFNWEHLSPESIIMRQGHLHSRFYVLAEGRAEALVTKKGSNSLQVNSFVPGDAFGEISLFTAAPAPTTIKCVTDCTLLTLDSEHFARMLLKWPKLYHRFIEKLSHSLHQANLVLWEAKHKEFLRSSLQLNQYEDKFYGIWGSWKTTKETEAELATLGKKDEHLLLTGERGTGRQMLAWYLHKQRFGESAPFIVVDGRYFDQQWGDQVFEGGSEEEHSGYSGSGLLDLVAGGTLLIREINLISPRAQLRLSHAMQAVQHKCLVVGSMESSPEFFIQLIPELVAAFTQSFRIEPLRERKRDIPVIALGVLQKLAQKNNRPTPVLDPEATKILLSHNYRQGNVTELIQVIERAFYLEDNNIISLEHIFFGPTAAKLGRSINLMGWRGIASMFKKGSAVLWLQRISSGAFAAILLLLVIAPKSSWGILVFSLLWGLWWPALAIISPIFGRVWCTVCPFSYVMASIQRKFHLNKPIPDFLKQYDYLFTTFLFLLIFWLEAITGMRSHPGYTVILLLSIQAAAIALGVV